MSYRNSSRTLKKVAAEYKADLAFATEYITNNGMITKLGFAGVDGRDLPVQNGDTLDLREGQPAQLILPAARYAVRAGMAADQIFDLLGQPGRRVDHGGDLFLRVLVDDKLIVHRISSFRDQHSR